MITKCNGMPTSGITTEYLRSLALVVWHQLLVHCQQKKATSKGVVQAPRGRALAIVLVRVKGLIYRIISLKLRSLVMEMTIQT